MTDNASTRAGRRGVPGRLRRLVAPVTDPARAAVSPLARAVQQLWARSGPARRTVSPAGRSVAAIGVLSWLVGWQLGWVELFVVAAACLILLALAAVMLIGTTKLSVQVVVEPVRVTVGSPVTGEVSLTNEARSPLLPTLLELPVGTGGVRFGVPLLGPGRTHREIFVVPTERRGVVPVGPASTARGDSIGLFRREVAWTGIREIFVHPQVVPLEPLGSGLLRDLEGTTAENISLSDLAFHALREYAPGDDLRHIHWRSSAKAGQLLVRQFLDTRRSHVNVVVDSNESVYEVDEDYETAVSIGASVLVRAISDGYDTTFVSGAHAMSRATGRSALDVCARVELGSERLIGLASKAARLAPDTSLAIFVTGASTEFIALQRVAAQFPMEAAKLVIRIDPSQGPRLRLAGDLALLSLGHLSDLPMMLRVGAR